ncbi:MAG TPA: tripartite tricarboxylate transporter substrate binding protein [Nitrobacter sp.]|jgi:tripartite-type tricarboxylate transporter receptor subunit TctC|nr:tripartite tricarboxylate transporter substrate binding protein [Nitrobacter sp.]
MSRSTAITRALFLRDQNLNAVGKLALRAATLMMIGGLTVLSPGSDAHAQTQYPTRSVKILVGFPAGTAPDTLARLVADRLHQTLGQPVIIETAVGASGNIAADRLAKAAPDGDTLLMAGNATLVVNQSLYQNLPFDPTKFVPISQIAITPNILVVHRDVPAKTVQELVSLARSQPDALAYAHVGPGTSQQLGAELFKQMAGIKIRSVYYRGGNTALLDLVSGRVQVCFCNIATTLPLVRDGKLRALAITSQKRSASAPDLPTMEEAGFKGFHADAWFGLVAPAGTPPSIVTRLHEEIAKLVSEPAFVKTLNELGMEVVGNSPKQFATVIAGESHYWNGMIQKMGLKIQ